MPMFRKKPVVIEAIQWDGYNYNEMGDWMGLSCTCEIDGCFVIPTLEGEMRASPGDFVIKGVNGEFYPCKPEIFAKTYEPAETRAPDPDLTAAEARVKVLEEALRERDGGRHDQDCRFLLNTGRPCNCGHVEALAALEGEKT